MKIKGDKQLDEVLRFAANNNKNVLIIGGHGIGKTFRAMRIFDEIFGAREDGAWEYLSASTADPYTDFVGVPVPEKDADGNDDLKFIAPQRIVNAHALMIDEANRGDEKIQNGIMEITQFKTINGVKMPNLKVVWAAINPPGGAYHGATAMDAALLDRFHFHIELEADPQQSYYSRQFPDMDTSKIDTFINWWKNDLTEEVQEILTPRRLESMMECWNAGATLEMVEAMVPHGTVAPVVTLVNRLNVGDRRVVDRKALYDHERAIISEIQDGNYDTAADAAAVIEKCRFPGIIDHVSVLEALTPEMKYSVANSISYRYQQNVDRNDTVASDTDLRSKFGNRADQAKRFISVIEPLITRDDI